MGLTFQPSVLCRTTRRAGQARVDDALRHWLGSTLEQQVNRFINEEKRVQSNFRSAAAGVLIVGTVFASVISATPVPASAATSQAAPVGVVALETNSAVDPIGIPLTAPRLSWPE